MPCADKALGTPAVNRPEGRVKTFSIAARSSGRRSQKPRNIESNDPPTAPGRARTATVKPELTNRREHLRGPIPLDWLTSAARLPGKSLHVGIALWFMRGLQKSRVVSLSNVMSARFGLDRNAKYRGLGWLEGAGLVTVERKLGRAPIITINNATSMLPLGPTDSGAGPCPTSR